MRSIRSISMRSGATATSARRRRRQFSRSLPACAFFLTHGHLFGVKSNLTRLKLEANRVGAQVALFGHTHRAFCEQDGGVWYLNPGAAKNDCYGVVEVRDGKIHCALKTLSDEK